MSNNTPYGSDYKWPTNLFIEMMDMGKVSFISYTFGYIADVARKEKAKENGKPLKGFYLDSSNAQDSKSTTKNLKRSYTPSDIKAVVNDNIDILREYYPSVFDDIEMLNENLTAMEKRAKSNDGDLKPLTLEEFDDKYQKKELVYALTKDSVNKRITIAFRGTDTSLALVSNWKANLSIAKVDAPLPEYLKGKIDQKKVGIHTGFYNYLFSKTHDENDAEDRTKYDEIVSELKDLLTQYPDHMVYVTGHSLGAALSTVMAFFLSCEKDIPSPVSCINFASPRVGDDTFFAATTYLERTKKLRMLRSVNENDLVTTFPNIGYKHVGWQVTTYKETSRGKTREPEIYYSGRDLGCWGNLREAWGNCFVSNLNLTYDHGAYLKRINASKEYLQKENLNTMYSDPKLVGFSLE